MDPAPEPYPPGAQVHYLPQKFDPLQGKSIQYPPYTTYILPEEEPTFFFFIVCAQ